MMNFRDHVVYEYNNQVTKMQIFFCQISFEMYLFWGKPFYFIVFILFFGHVNGVTDHYKFAVSFKCDGLNDSSPRLWK